MKVALGMICQNEEYYLSLILPIIRPCFEEFVAVDGGSTDRTKEILLQHDCKLIERKWDHNFSSARNEVIKHITKDWCVMLDADEAMFPGDIEKLRLYMSSCLTISQPRIEFVLDHDHTDSTVFPDKQCRVFRVGAGCKFRNVVHEMLYVGDGSSPAIETGSTYAEDCPIYHYGQCKPRHLVWLKHHNYGLISKGLSPLERVPDGFEVPPRQGITHFGKPHPLRKV